MPDDRARNRPHRDLTTKVLELTDDQLMELVDELIGALVATTSARFVESLRSVPPSQYKSYLLDLAQSDTPQRD